MFIPDRDGGYINIDHVFRFQPRKSGELMAYDEKGINIGETYYWVLDAFLEARMLPAAQGHIVSMVTVFDDGTYHVDELPVVAWRIVHALGVEPSFQAIPISPEAPTSNSSMFLHLPNGKFMQAHYGGETFDNLDAGITEFKRFCVRERKTT
jgi:hypothetical protein